MPSIMMAFESDDNGKKIGWQKDKIHRRKSSVIFLPSDFFAILLPLGTNRKEPSKNSRIKAVTDGATHDPHAVKLDKPSAVCQDMCTGE